MRPHSKGRFVSERDRNKVLYTRCCTQNPANRTKKKERKEQVSYLFDSKGTLQEYGIGFFSSSSFAAFRPVEEKETCSSSFGGRTSKDIHILSARMQRFADFGLGIDRAQCSLYTHQQEESVALKDSADYWTGRKSRVDECALPRRHRVEQFFYDIKKRDWWARGRAFLVSRYQDCIRIKLWLCNNLYYCMYININEKTY